MFLQSFLSVLFFESKLFMEKLSPVLRTSIGLWEFNNNSKIVSPLIWQLFIQQNKFETQYDLKVKKKSKIVLIQLWKISRNSLEYPIWKFKKRRLTYFQDMRAGKMNHQQR